MSSTKYSHKQFNKMFWQSVKKSCFFPIAAFVCLVATTFIENTDLLGYSGSYNEFFFWKYLYSYFMSKLVVSSFILAGLVNAFIIFGFVFSKKKCNVEFALGMTRKGMFISRFLAGTIPMAVGIVIAGLLELYNQHALGLAVNKQTVFIMIYSFLIFFGAYLLTFAITSVSMINSGNAVEGFILAVIIATFPYVLKGFLSNIIYTYTLGGVFVFSDSNLFDPFGYYFSLIDVNAISSFPNKIYIQAFTIAFYDFAVSILLLLIGLFTFTKRKNEIAGTWGKSKFTKEISAGLIAFYAFTLMLIFSKKDVGHGNGNILSFVYCCAAAFAGYFIFKLIFGAKDKKSIYNSIRYFPAYIVGFVIVTVIFSTGLFGYSFFVPDASEVENVSISTQLWAYDDVINSGDSFFGLKRNNVPYVKSWAESDNDTDNEKIFFNNESDIEVVTGIHSEIVKDGKIKDNASNACGNFFHVVYTLKNGKTVERIYTETSQETAHDILKLNNMQKVKNNVMSKHEYDKMTFQYDTSDDSDIYSEYGMEYMFVSTMYLFPTDMKEGYNAGIITDDLYKAIMKDIIAQSSNSIFFHSGQDEIGIISFGLSTGPQYKNSAYDYELPDYTNVSQSGNLFQADWNINSDDINTLVITKDMTNTIKYFEEKDLMKYFKSTITADDVKSIKSATMKELYKNKNSENLPLFYAGYSPVEYVNLFNNNFNWQKWGFKIYFDNIDKTITKKTAIQKVLDNAFVYGYCGNDYRIVEITYNDGAVATKCITADAYKEIFD
jgi:hypothetical protein